MLRLAGTPDNQSWLSSINNPSYNTSQRSVVRKRKQQPSEGQVCPSADKRRPADHVFIKGDRTKPMLQESEEGR